MRIGIDCDGVLRDLIPCLIDSIKETHPEHADKIKVSRSWDWEDWLPFWTNEETEKYVFEDNYIDLFGVECPPIKEAVDDWKKLKRWAEDNGHELVLVSAQKPQCEELTDMWLEKYGFDFKEKHYTHDKWSIDVDVLIDDSPEKLKIFKERSVSYGNPICMRQTWNTDCQKKYMTIDRLSDIMTRVFG
jgi:5'(3')-deoxyribonucleotidase